MSSSIAIPTASSSSGGPSHHHHLRRHHRHHLRSIDAGVGSSSGPHTSTAMSPSSSTSSSAHSPASSLASSSDFSGSLSKSPSVLSQSPLSARKQRILHQRRPSLLSMPHPSPSLPYLCGTGSDVLPGSAISKQEAQVINIGDPDGPPRLVCNVRIPLTAGWTFCFPFYLTSTLDIVSLLEPRLHLEPW